MQARTDKELIEAYAKSHDEAAFAELASRYQQLVYRTCYRLVWDVHEAEDATQAAFIVLARKAGSLRQEGKLNGWLHRVARNVGLQALRRRADRARQRERTAQWQEMGGDQAEDEVDTEAVLGQVDKELDGLSAVLREAVLLRHLRGYSEKDAAKQAGCAVSAMKWRTSRGIAKLRARLARRGVALSATALAGVLASEASATVPETLLPSILLAAKSVAATTAATAGVSSSALALAEGVTKMMFYAKLKLAAAVVTAVAVVGGSGMAVTNTVMRGTEPAARDLRIDQVAVDSEGSLRDALVFDVTVRNEIQDELTTTMTLEEEGKQVANKRITLRRGDNRVTIASIPEVEGNREFKIKLPLFPDKVNSENNECAVHAKIVK